MTTHSRQVNMKFPTDMNQLAHDVEDVLRDVREHVILSVEKYSMQIAFILMSITSAILVFGTVYVWCFHHPPKYNEDEKTQENKKKGQRDDVVNDKKKKVDMKDVKNDVVEDDIQSSAKKANKSPSRIPARQNSRQNGVNSGSAHRHNSSGAEDSQDDSSLDVRDRHDSDVMPEADVSFESDVSKLKPVNGGLKLNTAAASAAAAAQDMKRQDSSPRESPKPKSPKSAFLPNSQSDDVRRRKTSSSNNNNESPVKSKIPVRLQSH